MAGALFTESTDGIYPIPRYNSLIGPIRFRQYRVKSQSCDISGFPQDPCYDSYATGNHVDQESEDGFTYKQRNTWFFHNYLDPSQQGLYYPISGKNLF